MSADAQVLTKTNVLVTGAAGFIGTALCSALSKLGACVIGAGRSESPPGFPGRWVRCDLCEPASVEGLLSGTGPAYVFHMAGRTLGQQGREAVWPNLRDNLLGTVTLLLALSQTPCRRVVMTGSLREPAGSGDDTPSSPYAAAKAAGCAYARMFHRLYGLPVVIARLYMVYGPGPQDMTKLVPYVASRLAGGKEVLLSSGEAAFDFVFIDDVVDGLIALAMNDGLEGQTLDLGTGKLTSVTDVAHIVATRMGAGADALRLGAMPDRRFEPIRKADTATTERLTGWRARTPLTDGIDQFVRWHAALGGGAFKERSGPLT